MRDRILTGLAVAGFGFGTATHAWDFMRFGWWPYQYGPVGLTLFWNALVLLDAVVVVLLLTRRRVGLSVGIAVMMLDVVANSYAWRALGYDGFDIAVPIQAAFLIFLLIAWPALAGRHCRV